MRSPEDVAMDVFGATRQYRADIIRADRRALVEEVKEMFNEWSHTWPARNWAFNDALDALLEEK